MTAASIAARLERVPIGAGHRRLLWMGGLGNAFDALDATAFAFMLPALIPLWHLQPSQAATTASAIACGFIAGAFGAGALGDVVGRRAVMLWALAVYCVATLAAAFSPSWTAFVALRVVAGVGTGAEIAIIAPYLAEFIPSARRGAFVAAITGFLSFGAVAAALLGAALVPASHDGWRLLSIVTAVPIVVLLWWRRSLPESPRWLAAAGRTSEADAVVSRFEAEALRASGGRALRDAVPDAAPPVPAANIAANLARLWRRPLLRITVMSWLLWLALSFAYFSFFVWLPTLLVKSGFPIAKSLQYSLLIFSAQIPGYYSVAWLIERVGRRTVIVAYLVCAAAAAFGLMHARSDAAVLLCGALLSFFTVGCNAGASAYTAELYPTGVRATGVGAAVGFGRAGAIVAPAIIGVALARAGFGGVFAVITAVLAVGALAVIAFGPSTTGRTLEAIAAGDGDAPAGARSGLTSTPS